MYIIILIIITPQYKISYIIIVKQYNLNKVHKNPG